MTSDSTTRPIRRAVYAGSFDPPTNGHLYMISQGSRLFDELIVTVGVNPDKCYCFSVEDRISFLQTITKQYENVRITSFSKRYLVHYAEDMKADALLRGIRNSQDLIFEQAMRNVNSDMNSDITSVFLMPPRQLADISSSFVKGLVGPDNWQDMVARFVPGVVLDALIQAQSKSD
jgi:pantetheine-phosphate adenylyltransferase